MWATKERKTKKQNKTPQAELFEGRSWVVEVPGGLHRETMVMNRYLRATPV